MFCLETDRHRSVTYPQNSKQNELSNYPTEKKQRTGKQTNLFFVCIEITQVYVQFFFQLFVCFVTNLVYNIVETYIYFS